MESPPVPLDQAHGSARFLPGREQVTTQPNTFPPSTSKQSQLRGLPLPITGKQSGKKSLLGKMAIGVVTGGFDAGYFFECEVSDGEVEDGDDHLGLIHGRALSKAGTLPTNLEGVTPQFGVTNRSVTPGGRKRKLKGVLFAPVLTSQRVTNDGKPTLTLPSYCYPGAMTYAGAIQRIEFRVERDGPSFGAGNDSTRLVGRGETNEPIATWRDAALAARGQGAKKKPKKVEKTTPRVVPPNGDDDRPMSVLLAADVAADGHDSDGGNKRGAFPKGKTFQSLGKSFDPSLADADLDAAIAEAAAEAAAGGPDSFPTGGGMYDGDSDGGVLGEHLHAIGGQAFPPIKRGRGRPKGSGAKNSGALRQGHDTTPKPKPKRPAALPPGTTKRGPGRPRKNETVTVENKNVDGEPPNAKRPRKNQPGALGNAIVGSLEDTNPGVTSKY